MTSSGIEPATIRLVAQSQPTALLRAPKILVVILYKKAEFSKRRYEKKSKNIDSAYNVSLTYCNVSVSELFNFESEDHNSTFFYSDKLESV